MAVYKFTTERWYIFYKKYAYIKILTILTKLYDESNTILKKKFVIWLKFLAEKKNNCCKRLNGRKRFVQLLNFMYNKKIHSHFLIYVCRKTDKCARNVYGAMNEL